jgi:hypothetical protein
MLEDRTLLSNVHALFDLSTPATGPFPSNWFTIADNTQNTGRRINLPLPNPVTHPSDYQDTQVLNTLDGFNLQPRLSIPFDGQIDVNTVNSKDVLLISLGDTLPGGDPGGEVVGINQIIWDPPSKTLHVESDDLLDQHTGYALIITQDIRDLSGHHVKASQEFTHFVHHGQGQYHQAIVQALEAAEDHGIPEHDIVVASVFTTESTTAILEKIRDQVHAARPEPAEFNLGPDGSRTVFALDQVNRITWLAQTGDSPPTFTFQDPITEGTDVGYLRIIPGAVGEIAFGKYLSPDYEVHPGEYIPPVGTRTGTPEVQGYNEVYFNLVLPSGPKPAGGWPVAIFGHGNTNSKNWAFKIAATMAEHGIATIAINAVGHGFGPLGTLTLDQTVGGPVTFLSGGRGIDQDGDHEIGGNEGVAAAPPRAIISRRDGAQQTAVDLMQLVREIQVGMDVHGDGTADLDASRISFLSISFGGSYGAPFLAVEPSVRVGVLNVVGGSWVDKAGRLSPNSRPGIATALAVRVPSLINGPGIAELDGRTVAGPRFNENMPLRDGLPLPVRLEDGTSYAIQSPVTNTVAGAMAIQEVLENQQWVTQAGNPLAYAPYLRKEPLEGGPAKSVIVQFAKGDDMANNPMTTAILRAGDLADRATYYRTDLAYAEDHNVTKLPPHVFMIRVYEGQPFSDALVRAIALGAQEQIATFFASDGAEIIQPPGVPEEFFEVPIQGPLPEDLNFIPPESAPGPTGAVTRAVASPPSLDLAAIVEGLSSSQAAPVLPVPGITLWSVLPSPVQHRTAVASVPVAQPGRPSPLAPGSLRRATPGAPLPLLDRLFAGLDSSVALDDFGDGVAKAT